MISIRCYYLVSTKSLSFNWINWLKSNYWNKLVFVRFAECSLQLITSLFKKFSIWYLLIPPRPVLPGYSYGVWKASVCCVFWPAFRCCAHQKAGWTTFFCRFQQKINRKKTNSRYPLKESTSFCISTSFEDWQISLFLFIFRCFLFISEVKSINSTSIGLRAMISK